MTRRTRIPHLGGAKAVVLHREHPSVDVLIRQLGAIGLEVVQAWPDLPASATGADFLFFDVDHGFDEQFPWKAGEAPMPLRRPDRLGSAGAHRVGAVAAGGRADRQARRQRGRLFRPPHRPRAFDERRRLGEEIASLRRRIGERQTVVRAVVPCPEPASARNRPMRSFARSP